MQLIKVRKWFIFKINIVVFVLCVSFIFSCQDNSSYSINKTKYILLNDSLCEVISYYPSISTSYSDSVVESLNKILEGINEMNHYTKECSRLSISFGKKITVIGSYSVLFESENLISLEYMVSSTDFLTKHYRSVFINPKEMKLVEQNIVFPINDRSLLFKYVKSFCDSTNININLLAYEKNSNYSIMYGLTPDDLILYLGGEGEFLGYYKILIPLKELEASQLSAK